MLALLLLGVAGLTSSAAASAHSTGPWFGTYEVAVQGGSQHTEWSADHASTGTCDPSLNGQGSDSQTFLPGAGKVVQITGVGLSAFPATISGLELNYTEDREGSLTTGQVPPACVIASGEGTATPPSPDCGTRSLSTSIDVTPLPGDASLQQSPGASTGTSPYEDCPVFGAVVPAFASPLAATLPPLGPALEGAPPSATALMQAAEPLAESDVTGQSTLKLELRFTRLFVVDALGMPGDAALTVGASGDTTVPLSCPAGGACSGSVALEFDTSATGARVASAPRFPQPVSGYTIALASTRFRLRAGQRGVVLHLHGGRVFARALASDTLAVVVTEGSGRKSARYVAGLAHVRV